MVRLELKSGSEIYVNPSQVSHVLHGYVDGWTGVHVGGTRFEVKGEPQDVLTLLSRA